MTKPPVPPDQRDRLRARRQKPKPPPQPAPVVVPPLVVAARNVIFCAQVPDEALDWLRRTPGKYKWAISADQAYADDALKIADAGKAQGRTLFAWSDCEYTTAQEAMALADAYNLNGWVGQGETPGQYAHAIAAGAEILVGNPNAWTAEQRTDAIARCSGGKLAVIVECYVSESGHPFPNAYGTQGVPPASWCYGIYRSTHGYVTLNDYVSNTPPGQRPHAGLYHAAGAMGENPALLP